MWSVKKMNIKVSDNHASLRGFLFQLPPKSIPPPRPPPRNQTKMRFALTAVLALTASVFAQSSQGSSASSASASKSSVSASRAAPSPLASRPAPPRAARRRPAPPPCSRRVSLGCLTAAANATECGSPANLTCACTNADFQFKSSSCLQAECLASELGAAVGLQQAQCGALSLSATAAPTATAPFTPLQPRRRHLRCTLSVRLRVPVRYPRQRELALRAEWRQGFGVRYGWWRLLAGLSGLLLCAKIQRRGKREGMGAEGEE
ncbi:hypothetical protein B0H14DRAFT_3126259 [Mycena olivaceomarginata]|nr:hypothetical protein B0H14DRAFT_3126259 [Mycena olivaceomarginata]